MRSRVIPHGGLTNVGVHDGIDFVANTKGAPPFRVFCGGWGFYDDLMRSHALNRRITSCHVGDDGIVIVRVKPSLVADLPARVGIERSVIKDNLARVSGLEFLRALPVLDDGQHFATGRTSLPITFED